MPQISDVERISKILLDSEKPLTYHGILAKWPVRRRPDNKRLQQLLSKYKQFVRVGTEIHQENTREYDIATWTHQNHSMLQSSSGE